jgi:8-oxo-dGTP pyrophosphatase MutT (NUDIX family)
LKKGGKRASITFSNKGGCFMTMPRHSLSAGAVVLNDEGKILLIKGPRRGWEFPGGVIELGETIEDGITMNCSSNGAYLEQEKLFFI